MKRTVLNSSLVKACYLLHFDLYEKGLFLRGFAIAKYYCTVIAGLYSDEAEPALWPHQHQNRAVSSFELLRNSALDIEKRNAAVH